MLKSRKMKVAGHVERVGKKRNACMFWVGRPERKRRFRKPYVDGRLIL
jgi:hypothetical protein